VLVEPIRGRRINISTMQYLRDLRELCDRQKLVPDGRRSPVRLAAPASGLLPTRGIRPDRLAARQGPCSGVPIGAASRASGGAGFRPGMRRFHFGGNPLACAAALRRLTPSRRGLLKNAERIGGILLGGLREALAGLPGVAEIRGHGLMIAWSSTGLPEISSGGHWKRILINVTWKRRRLLPPLVMNEVEARQGFPTCGRLVRVVLATTPHCLARA